MWSKSKSCWLDLQSRSQSGPFLTISTTAPPELSPPGISEHDGLSGLPPSTLAKFSTQNIRVVSKHTVYHITPLLKTQQLPFCTKVLEHLMGPCNILVSVTLLSSSPPCFTPLQPQRPPWFSSNTLDTDRLPMDHFCTGFPSVWNVPPGGCMANSFIFKCLLQALSRGCCLCHSVSDSARLFQLLACSVLSLLFKVFYFPQHVSPSDAL